MARPRAVSRPADQLGGAVGRRTKRHPGRTPVRAASPVFPDETRSTSQTVSVDERRDEGEKPGASNPRSGGIPFDIVHNSWQRPKAEVKSALYMRRWRTREAVPIGSGLVTGTTSAGSSSKPRAIRGQGLQSTGTSRSTVWSTVASEGAEGLRRAEAVPQLRRRIAEGTPPVTIKLGRWSGSGWGYRGEGFASPSMVGLSGMCPVNISGFE